MSPDSSAAFVQPHSAGFDLLFPCYRSLERLPGHLTVSHSNPGCYSINRYRSLLLIQSSTWMPRSRPQPGNRSLDRSRRFSHQPGYPGLAIAFASITLIQLSNSPYSSSAVSSLLTLSVDHSPSATPVAALAINLLDRLNSAASASKPPC
jgi:hypothetical protein